MNDNKVHNIRHKLVKMHEKLKCWKNKKMHEK